MWTLSKIQPLLTNQNKQRTQKHHLVWKFIFFGFAEFLRVVSNLCMFLLVGSGGKKQFLAEGSSLVGSIGGPDVARLRHQVSEEIHSASTLGPDPIGAPLSDSGNFLEFLMGNLEYAIFSRARTPVFGMSLGIKNRDMARQPVQDRGHLSAYLCVNGGMSLPVEFP